MEFHLLQASQRFEVFMPRFKEAGLKKSPPLRSGTKKARRWLDGCLSMKTLKRIKHANRSGKKSNKLSTSKMEPQSYDRLSEVLYLAKPHCEPDRTNLTEGLVKKLTSKIQEPRSVETVT